jgi:hypothetical protein
MFIKHGRNKWNIPSLWVTNVNNMQMVDERNIYGRASNKESSSSHLSFQRGMLSLLPITNAPTTTISYNKFSIAHISPDKTEVVTNISIQKVDMRKISGFK